MNPSFFHDIKHACSKYLIWTHLGVLDVKQRYRRSTLGPWWITINMCIFVSAMGVIFGRVLSQNFAEYMPFFATGFLLWSFISTSVTESTELFKIHSGFIKQMSLPFNLYVLKFFTRNLIVFAHNFVVYLLVIALFRLNPGWNVCFSLLGMVFLLVNLYWICLIVALLSTRFRDMSPIVGSSMQLLFFVTPISWVPKLIGENSVILKINPFVYFIEIVRQPLLGSVPPFHYWLVSGSCAVIGLLFSLVILHNVKSRIPFWVD